MAGELSSGLRRVVQLFSLNEEDRAPQPFADAGDQHTVSDLRDRVRRLPLHPD